MHDVAEAGLLADHLEAQVIDAAHAARSEMQHAGLALGQRHELAKILHRQLGRHDYGHRRIGDGADRREIALHVDGEVLVEQRVGDDDAAVDVAERVAVRRALGDGFQPDAAVGAGTIVDHERLPKYRLNGLREVPRHQVGAAARRKADDDAYRTRGYCCPHARAKGMAAKADASRLRRYIVSSVAAAAGRPFLSCCTF